MTISLTDNNPRISYTVNAGATQTSFTVPFEFFDIADLNVYVDGTQKSATTHYTVSSGGSGSTGTIALTVTGASGGSTVVITRDIDLARTTDFPTSGSFNIAALNTELDKITAQFADRKDDVDRSLRLQDSDTAASMELPLKDTRKGTVLGFNATTGVPEAGPTIADVSTLSAITSDIATLADIEDGTDATDAIQTVAGISSNVTTVAGISGNVTSVAGNASNINAVAGNATNINTVAGKDSEITSVAAKASLLTSDFVSDLNTLAVTDVINDINTLATSDIVSDLNTLATSDIVSDLNTLATSDIVSDINTLATSDIVTDLNLLATSDFVADLNTMATTTNVNNLASVAGNASNINAVAGNNSNITAAAGNASNINAAVSNASNINTVAGAVSNVNTVAGISTDVTSVAGVASNIPSVAGKATEIGLLGVSSVITDMGILGTSDAVSDMNTLAAISSDISSLSSALEKTYAVTVTNPGSGNVFVLDGSNAPTITIFRGNTYIFDQSDSSNAGHPIAFKDSGGSAYTTGVTSTGTPGSSGAKTTFNVPSNAPNSLRYYCTAHGNSMGNTISVTDSNISLVATNIANVNLTGGSITNVNNVGGSIANVNTVATNLSSINDFADKYRIGSSDPSSSNDEGDLFYNTTSNTLKVYNGSAWEGGVTAGSGFLALTGGQLTGNLTFSGSQTVDGRDVSADGAKLDGIEASATADQTEAGIRAAVEAATDSNVFTDADHSKLNAIEASADVTDTANVVSALTAGTNIAIAGDGTISSTDTNTTYSAGAGLDLNGTTFSHTDTSSQASSNNSGRTYIQDITLDTYGHVTGIATATETVVNTDTNTTYSADGDYGITLSGTTFRLEDDRRRNSSTVDVFSGNAHDYTMYDQDVGIRWFTAAAEEMRLQNNGTLHVDGDIIAYSNTISDRRLKTDIAKVENGLDKVSALNGYTFKYINGDMQSAGVMADEIKPVLPSAVKTAEIPLHTDTPEEYDIVHYDQLCAIFIEAIKELKSRVEALENGG